MNMPPTRDLKKPRARAIRDKKIRMVLLRERARFYVKAELA